MDEVLARLLKVEQEAEQIVADAEQKAAQIIQEGNAKLADQREKQQRALEQRIQDFIQTQEQKAVEQKQKNIEQASKKLAAWSQNIDPATIDQATNDALKILIDNH